MASSNPGRIGRPWHRHVGLTALVAALLIAVALPAAAQTADDPVDPTATTVVVDPGSDTATDPTIPSVDSTVAPNPEPEPAPEPGPAPEASTATTVAEAAPEPHDGGDYGDLWVILRDVDGVPILDANSCVQPYDLEGNLIQLDAECALPEGVVAQEVEFGRLNMGRSPETVLDTQFEDVSATLLAGQPLHLDEAGRLVTVDDDLVDSPGQNLAIHRQLALGLDIPGVTLPTPNAEYDDYDTTAAAIGAAADKGGLLTVDVIEYNNEILDIPARTTLPTITRSGGTYVDYRNFTYDRAATFPGCLRYEVDEFSGYETDTVMRAIFGGQQYTGSNVAAYVQAADDARRVIEYTHLLYANVSFIDRVYESGRYGDCPPPPEPTMFTDVMSDYWAAPGIIWLGDNNIVNPYPDGTFRPKEPILRGEAIVWLYKIAGRPDVSSLPPLEAVDVPTWMQPAVRWAVGNGYIWLNAEDQFRPYNPMTRGKLVKTMWKIEGAPTGSPANTFPDVPDRFDLAVDWMVDPAHVPVYANAFADGTFRPGDATKRSFAATWMYNVYGPDPLVG
ncbi:MAG: S-layer homology domain-containing protein [Acidimicrobiales bacterium]|nr:S-layer homology domain-containing protein [Acidimicrobiales bacterium]